MPSIALIAQDILDCQHLYAQYSFGVDTANADILRDIFNPDFELTLNAGVGPREKFSRDSFIHFTVTENGGVGTRHLPINIFIKGSPEGATGRAHLLGIFGAQIVTTGFYEDTFIKTPEGWKFKTRQVWVGSYDKSPYAPKKRE